MARDYYTEAGDIARILEQDGLAADARALLDAMDTGSTATEILMALKWHLQRIDESNSEMSSQTRRRIRDLYSAIQDALGR